jgi:hypothetical protein
MFDRMIELAMIGIGIASVYGAAQILIQINDMQWVWR